MSTGADEKAGFFADMIGRISSVDQQKMREIARAVHEDPHLLEAFARDPEGVAHTINGFVVPDGFHIHIADGDNNFVPAEEPGAFGSEAAGDWVRIETRAGYRSFSLVVCAAIA